MWNMKRTWWSHTYNLHPYMKFCQCSQAHNYSPLLIMNRVQTCATYPNNTHELFALLNLIYTTVFLTDVEYCITSNSTIKGQAGVFLRPGMKTNTTNITQQKA